MLKKSCFILLEMLVLGAALLAPVLTASAGGVVASHVTQPRKASLYVNAGVGIDIFNSYADNTNFSFASGNVGLDVTHNTRVINSSPAVSVGFGYTYPINHWANLGARAFVRYADNFGSYTGRAASLGTIRFENTTELKLRQFEYGIDFTPSANIGANQFLTGIFGVAFNRVRILNTTAASSGPAGPLDPGTVQSSMKRSLRGVRVGYSLEELLNRNFSVYMTYIWTGYGSIHSLQSTQVGSTRASASNSGIKLETHNILLGLKYYLSPQNYRKHFIAHAFNGFYAGLSFGNLIPQIQSGGEYRGTNATGVNSFIAVHNGAQGAPTPAGTLGLGYGFLIHHFYLGAEALLNIASRISKSEFTNESVNSTVYVENFQNIRILLNTLEGDFDLKFGGTIAPQTLLLGRVGIAVNHIRMENFATDDLATAGPNAYLTQQVSKDVVGLRFGLGLEKMISKSFSLKMNYVYTYYGHIFGKAAASPNPATVPNITATASARVATHAVTVGMNYYF